ncbi:MAG: PHP domain-containing protein, partial [Clostridia bacterium]|nr:PHP domain-containing protein [Clostridia bacterium]
MEKRFDLHAHSNVSDGTFSPTALVQAAREAGLRLLALTDHDCVDGVGEARRAGEAAGVQILAGVEFDCAFEHELHMLGLGLDTGNPALIAALEAARERRAARNARILEQLDAAGCELRPHLSEGGGSLTRLHIALALRAAGYAASLREAFTRYLAPGGPGYVPGYRETLIRPEEAIAVIHAAGGLAVWAHPMHAPANLHRLTDRLAAEGLDGLEAYHPSASEGDAALLLSLAEQHGLAVTCGSDFHGANRPGIGLGCTWRESPALEALYA